MWRVWLLGLVQGLTEFLPVSSSGHLVVMKYWFKVASPGATLEIVLHLGTLLAILLAYRRDLAVWLRDLAKGGREAYQLLLWVGVATLPAAMLGYIFEDWVGQYFVPSVVVFGWLITSILLWLTPPATEASFRTMSDLTWWEVLAIGCMQALALMPGLSRAGSTIFMGRALRLKPEEAARFSFYMAIPVITGAFLLSWLHHPTQLWETPDALSAMIISAIAGLFAIKWVKNTLGHGGAWRKFGFYTCAMALLTWWLGG